MRISTVISNLTQINTRIHADLQGLGADDHAQYGVEQGVFASRPAFGTEGRLYFATDLGLLYRDTGSAWEELSIKEANINLADLATKSFLDLSDTPASFSGQALKSLRINSAGDAVELFTPALSYDKQNIVVDGNVSATEITVASTTIPAGMLGANGLLHIVFSGQTNNLQGQSLTTKLKFGGTDVASLTQTSGLFFFDIYLGNKNSESSQGISGSIMKSGSHDELKAGEANNISVNTANAQDITVTLKKSASGTYAGSLGGYNVSIL